MDVLTRLQRLERFYNELKTLTLAYVFKRLLLKMQELIPLLETYQSIDSQ